MSYTCSKYKIYIPRHHIWHASQVAMSKMTHLKSLLNLCTLHIANFHCTLHIVHCKSHIFNAHCTLYIVHCTSLKKWCSKRFCKGNPTLFCDRNLTMFYREILVAKTATVFIFLQICLHFRHMGQFLTDRTFLQSLKEKKLNKTQEIRQFCDTWRIFENLKCRQFLPNL